MNQSLKTVVVSVALLLLSAGAGANWLLRRCCGAREAASPVEESLARTVRAVYMPREARAARNPFNRSQELLTEAARHFADHCASCHGNDGSGETELGRGLYPRVPDMRLPATQQLSDGELYYIIHNGIRWTGMPAWGEPGKSDEASWKLVLFIRHLPQITPDELKDMKQFNPLSPAEIKEEQAEQEFLHGAATGDGGKKP